VPEGGAAAYHVEVSLDGGLEMSGGPAMFYYYREPTISSASPALGPVRAGTSVTLHGIGFGQSAGCKRLIRLGHLHVEPSAVTNDTMTFEAPTVAYPATTVVSVSLNGQQFTRQPAVHAPARSVTYDFYRDPYASVHYPVRGPTNGGTPLKVQGFGFALHRPHLTDRLWARFVDVSTKSQELAPPTEVHPDQLRTDSFTWVTPAVTSASPAWL